MSLDGVSGKTIFYDKTKSSGQNRKPSEAEDGFFGSIRDAAVHGKEESLQEKETARDTKKSGQIDYSYGMSAAELMLLRNGRIKMSAVLECSVRHISYSESDDMKLFLSEGYSLKAKVELDEHRVYIEQKNEDGTVQAYEVNPLKIAKDTTNPVEQMALEAWEKARGLMNDGMFTEAFPETVEEAEDFEKMLEEFRVYVEKRLKDGPPKIPTGGSEFSEEEWEKMLRKIDDCIDAYKEELRERLREQEAAAGAGGQERIQRGGSMLARLSGEKRAPYAYLADASGQINYNGVIFVCDNKKKQICLGDMTDTKNVLNIPLSKGGSLRVNRDNLGDLAKAIGMFSAEDVGRILRAIARDARAQEMGFQIEMEKMEF